MPPSNSLAFSKYVTEKVDFRFSFSDFFELYIYFFVQGGDYNTGGLLDQVVL